MNNKIKTIIYMVIFCVFMIAMVFLYTKLSIKEDSKSNAKMQNNVDKSNSAKEMLKSFELYLEDGSKIDILSLTDKPLVINIWTSWCAYCKVEMAYFNEAYLKEKDNINFVMINVTGDRDSKENAKKFVNENNFDFDIYYDLELNSLKALGIYSYPTTIFVEKGGYINSKRVGMITKEELINKINELK